MANLEERRATLEEFLLFRENLFNDGHNIYEMIPWHRQVCDSIIIVLRNIEHPTPEQFRQFNIYAVVVRELLNFIQNDFDLCLEEINRYLDKMLQISHELDEESNDLWLFLVEGLNTVGSKFSSIMLRYWAEYERYRDLIATLERSYNTNFF